MFANLGYTAGCVVVLPLVHHGGFVSCAYPLNSASSGGFVYLVCNEAHLCQASNVGMVKHVYLKLHQLRATLLVYASYLQVLRESALRNAVLMIHCAGSVPK